MPIPDIPNRFLESPAFDGPLVDGAGRTFFKSGITGPSGGFTGDTGIFMHDGQSLHTLVADGQPVSALPGAVFDGIYPFDLAINSHGQYAFASSLSGTSVTSFDNVGLFQGQTDGTIDLVLREGDQAPGFATGVEFDALYSPEMNRDGRFAFLATIRGPGVHELNDETVWVQQADGQFALVAREGDAAPEAPQEVFFGDRFDRFQVFSDLVINARGQVAFRTRLKGSGLGNTSGNLNDNGVWATDGSGELRSIVMAGRPFDTLAGDARVHGLIIFAGDTGNDEGLATGFSDAGHVAFQGHFGNLSAIYVSSRVAIPEPSTLALGTLALASLVIWRRK